MALPRDSFALLPIAPALLSCTSSDFPVGPPSPLAEGTHRLLRIREWIESETEESQVGVLRCDGQGRRDRYELFTSDFPGASLSDSLTTVYSWSGAGLSAADTYLAGRADPHEGLRCESHADGQLSHVERLVFDVAGVVLSNSRETVRLDENGRISSIANADARETFSYCRKAASAPSTPAA